MSSKKSKKNKKPTERFGKYLILDHLVDGGMAKICRARYLGDHADKIVAIKMVQPQFSKDESFKTMFENEVKVSFGLIHPNIAQTYDHGTQNDQLYVAMEYVDGKNLKQYLDKLKANNYIFPIEICVYITSLVCQGLHYAHSYKDKLTGKEFNLIHRDISPHNIMLSYDGSVKVIDFGIAKAEINSDQTQAGTLKGKLSYLAPEYLEGMDLDPRYDEFAVGITLWEMLTSRKLFKAANDLAVLKEIQACKIPAPSTVNRNIPKELDQIVLKALSKDRNNRYDDLDMLNRALVKFLYTTYPNFNPSDLGKFAGQLFKDDIEKDYKLMLEFGKIDIKPFLDEMNQSDFSSESDNNADESIIKDEVFDFGFSDPNKKKKKRTSNSSSKEKAGKVELKARKITVNEEPVVENNQPQPVNQRVQGFNNKNIDNSSNKVMNTPNFMTKVASVGAILFGLYFGIQAIMSDDLSLTNSATKKMTAEKILKRVPSSHLQKKEGKLIFMNYQKYSHKVFLNGKVKRLSLMGEINVKLDTLHKLRVEKKDTEHFFYEFMLDSDNKVANVTIPDLPSAVFGYLVTSEAQCVSGTMTFDLFGQKRVERLPIYSRKGIPIPVGEITVNVELAGEGVVRSKTIFIKRENELIDLCEILFWD